MKTRNIFLFIFLIAVVVRAVLNFSTPLVPGLGGGYNLVQIRVIVEEGRLAFPDMPFLFYLNAWIVKFLLHVFPGADPERTIINVSKVIDTVGFPVLLYPLYMIQKELIRVKVQPVYLLAVAAFATLSFSPLDLACDAQKNTLALAMMVFFVFFFLQYLKMRSTMNLVFSLVTLILIALTHFGVFAVTLVFLVLALGQFFRWKAVLPIAAILLSGGLLIAVFDTDRALSLVTFWREAFSIFLSSRLMYYPYGIFNVLFSVLLVVLMIRMLRRRRAEMEEYERKIMLVLLILIVILAFPFYRIEYGRRLGLMLVIPQSIVLLLLFPSLRGHAASVLSYALLALVLLTVSFRLLQPKPLAITEESYADMKRLGSRISDPANTLIFARHGLEWWVAWELRVKIASAYLEVDDQMMDKYNQIYFLVQKKGENLIYPGKTSIFIQPVVPDNSELVYDSEYFEMFAFQPDT